MSEEEACDICDGGQSSKKNPIIFCDGEGCNLPVHKICYKVDEIPEDDWYCQRCVAKKRKKNINIICCPRQTGALKQTIVSDSYMHVVCAMWNKTIKDDMEPYSFNKRQLDLQECYLCSKKKGICIECEEPSCTTRFHATCAINNGLITSARSIPSDYSPRCGQHQPKPKPKPKRQKRRVIRRKEIITSSEEESEESDDDDDDEEEHEEHEDSEQEQEEEEEEEVAHESEESEDEMGKSSSSSSSISNMKKGKSIAPLLGTKRKEATSISKIKQPPEKKRSPHSLFANDQMSTDEDEDEDDMGTRSSSVSSSSKLKRYIDKNKGENNNNGIKQQPKANTVGNIRSSTLTATTSTAASTSTTSTATATTTQQQQQQQKPPSYIERFEAKRKKNVNEKSNMRLDPESKTASPPPSVIQQQISLPSSSSSSSSSPNISRATTSAAVASSSSSSSTIAPVPVKQKLPNKAHLSTPSSSKPQNVQRPPSMTPPIKKFTQPPVLDLDTMTNNISNSQRWNNNNSGVHTQPTTPHSTSVAFFENENRMASSSRRSIDEWRNGGDREELIRLREEIRRLTEFKRAVTDIFTQLKVVVPGTSSPSENIDLYVNELHTLLRRVGPMREEDDSRVRECVSNVLKNKR